MCSAGFCQCAVAPTHRQPEAGLTLVIGLVARRGAGADLRRVLSIVFKQGGVLGSEGSLRYPLFPEWGLTLAL